MKTCIVPGCNKTFEKYTNQKTCSKECSVINTKNRVYITLKNWRASKGNKAKRLQDKLMKKWNINN